MSLFKLYGVRDFVRPMDRRGLLGADGPPGESIVDPQGERGPLGESIVGPQGERCPQGESIVGPPGSDANVLLWVKATQSNVQLGAFGGTLAASRVTNIDYDSLTDKSDVVLPGYLSPIALTSNTQELIGLPSGNAIYAYTSSVSPNYSGFSLFRLSGSTQEARFSNVWGIVVTLALAIPSSIAKYAILAIGTATFPSDFTVRFCDVNNRRVGIDNRTTEVFTAGETKKFTVAATGVTNATLTINRIASISRGSSAYFVNSAG